jgi:hypothetical protein
MENLGIPTDAEKTGPVVWSVSENRCGFPVTVTYSFSIEDQNKLELFLRLKNIGEVESIG